MMELLFQTFSPIIGTIIKIENFLYELDGIITFVMFPLNWLKISKTAFEHVYYFRNIIPMKL